MYLLHTLLLSYLFYVHVEANDIVKKVLGEGHEGVPSEFLGKDVKYKQFLECSYEHYFHANPTLRGNDDENFNTQQHSFFLQCFELEGSSNKVAVLYFNAVAVDRLEVTTCDKSQVEKSIFPPKFTIVFGKQYSETHNHMMDGFYTQFRYVMEDGKCSQRLYRLDLNKEKEEYKFVERKQPTEENISGAQCGLVAFRCRAPRKEIKAVGAFGTPAEWTPYKFRDTPGFYGDPKGVTITRQTECIVQHPGPKTSGVFYELICVEARQGSKNNYFAFVNHGGSSKFAMEKFTVSSCMEDDLVNAIFVVRDKDPQSKSGRLRFKHDGKCYEREYFEDKARSKAAQEIQCPRTIYDWVNPKKDSATMWSKCYGPSSNAGEPKTLKNE